MQLIYVSSNLAFYSYLCTGGWGDGKKLKANFILVKTFDSSALTPADVPTIAAPGMNSGHLSQASCSVSLLVLWINLLMEQMETRVFEGTSRRALGNNHRMTSLSSELGAVASLGHVGAVCYLSRGVFVLCHFSVSRACQLSSHLQLGSTARRMSPPAITLSVRLRIFVLQSARHWGPSWQRRNTRTDGTATSPGVWGPGGQRHSDAGPRVNT